MDDVDFDQPYDSDAIDEEVEHRLYSAIFFEPTFNFPTKDSLLPSHNFPHATRPYPPTDEPNTPSKFSSIGNHVPIKLNVSSFKDDTDSDEFILNVQPQQDDSDSGDSHDIDSDSIIDLTSVDDPIPIFQSAPHRACSSPEWTAGDVVLGISHNSLSAESQLNESTAIARRLSSVSSNPNLWRLDPVDRVPSAGGGGGSNKGRDRRYFKDSQNTVCSNCRRRGHFTFDCQSSGPACILCGKEGHMKQECEDIYCFACLARGHAKRDCPNLEKLKYSVCKRCGLEGHRSYLCTEIWRQYMFTPIPGKPVRPGERMLVNPRGCCNCGNRGHSVDDCKRKPLRSNFLGPSPRRRVIVYDKGDVFSKPKPTKKHRETSSTDQSSKKLKRKKKMRANKKHDSTINMRDSTHDLAMMEHKVNQRLLEQVKQQQQTSTTMEQLPESISVSPSISSLDRVRAKRANDSVSTELAFLPLNTKPASRKKTNPPKGFNAPQSNPSLSPFMCINQRTAMGFINDDRPKSTPIKRSLYLEDRPTASTPISHVSHSGRRENRRKRKRKNPGNQICLTGKDTRCDLATKPTENKQQRFTAHPRSVSGDHSSASSHSKFANKICRAKHDEQPHSIENAMEGNLKKPKKKVTGEPVVNAVSSKERPRTSNWLKYIHQPPQIDAWDVPTGGSAQKLTTQLSDSKRKAKKKKNHRSPSQSS